MKPLLDSARLWVVANPEARSLSGCLGFKGKRAMGTNFIAAFFRRRFAVELAKTWPGGAVVRCVRLSEIPDHARLVRSRQ